MSKKNDGGIELKTIQDSDALHTLRVLCADCGEQLQESVPMTGRELKANWTQMAISQPLVTGSCSKGCRATFSDCNLNTNLEIVALVENDEREESG